MYVTPMSSPRLTPYSELQHMTATMLFSLGWFEEKLWGEKGCQTTCSEPTSQPLKKQHKLIFLCLELLK